jgi:hypothetical protein
LADDAAADDVSAQAAAVDEWMQERLSHQFDEVLAGLARTRAPAEDLADPETAADQLVEADATGGHVSPCPAGGQLDAVIARQRLDRLGLDQR